jgi:hypothetical protein
MTTKIKKFLSKAIFCLTIYILLTIQNSYSQTENIILGRPTDSAITASILFERNTLFYIQYTTKLGQYNDSNSINTALAGVPFEIELTRLQPNTQYYYRLKYHLTTESKFRPSREYSFHTQRSKGSTFSFTIEADEHLYDKKGVKSLYQICLNNQAKDKPDFMLSLGDIFGDDHNPFTITSAELDKLHKDYRPFIGSIAHSVPFYVCLGNHEGENDYYMSINPPNNLAIWGTQWRKFYYPNPYPNNFYSGNPDLEPHGIGHPENYYAWTWGDALFVVLDVYRDECDTSAKPINWEWSLGKPQYDWLKTTLEGSSAKFKFVFAHHIRGQGRGGITNAKLFEWGGYDGKNGTNFNFPNKRPGWAKPIHQLFKDNGVNIFFQGHDHVFSRESLDGVTYQAVPMPSDSTYKIGKLANASAYTSDTLDGSGHLRVTVSSDCIKVDYIKAFLPADTINGKNHNGEVAFSYTIGSCLNSISESETNDAFFSIYPNPANTMAHIELPHQPKVFTLNLYNMQGQKIAEDTGMDINLASLSDGIYFIEAVTEMGIYKRKLIVQH